MGDRWDAKKNLRHLHYLRNPSPHRAKICGIPWNLWDQAPAQIGPKDYLLCLSLQKKCHVLKIGSLKASAGKYLTKCIFLHIFRKYFFAIPCCVKCPYLVKCCPKLPPFSISASNNFPRFSSIGAIIFPSDSPNASCSTYITALANFHNPKYFNSLCTTSKAVEAEEVTTVVEPAELSPSIASRSHPAQFGEGFDAPPSLERSGSEHRVGRFSSSSLRGEDRDERWSPL